MRNSLLNRELSKIRQKAYLVPRGQPRNMPKGVFGNQRVKNAMEAMTTRAPVCSTNIEPGGRGAVLQRLLRVVESVSLLEEEGYLFLNLKYLRAVLDVEGDTS